MSQHGIISLLVFRYLLQIIYLSMVASRNGSFLFIMRLFKFKIIKLSPRAATQNSNFLHNYLFHHF